MWAVQGRKYITYTVPHLRVSGSMTKLTLKCFWNGYSNAINVWLLFCDWLQLQIFCSRMQLSWTDDGFDGKTSTNQWSLGLANIALHWSVIGVCSGLCAKIWSLACHSQLAWCNWRGLGNCAACCVRRWCWFAPRLTWLLCTNCRVWVRFRNTTLASVYVDLFRVVPCLCTLLSLLNSSLVPWCSLGVSARLCLCCPCQFVRFASNDWLTFASQALFLLSFFGLSRPSLNCNIFLLFVHLSHTRALDLFWTLTPNYLTKFMPFARCATQTE